MTRHPGSLAQGMLSLVQLAAFVLVVYVAVVAVNYWQIQIP